MASNIPTSRYAQLQWLEARAPIWSDVSETIGLNDSTTGELQLRVNAARAAYEASIAARNASKAATLAWHNAISEARELGGSMVNTIKAFAQLNEDPDVFVTAQINPDDPPTPAGIPEQPSDLRTTVRNTGAVELKWEGQLTQRAFFEILRRLENESTYKVIAALGAKTFIDETVPAGIKSVNYTVRARRGTLTSDTSEPVEVLFGIPQEEGPESLNLAA